MSFRAIYLCGSVSLCSGDYGLAVILVLVFRGLFSIFRPSFLYLEVIVSLPCRHNLHFLALSLLYFAFHPFHRLVVGLGKSPVAARRSHT